jgi:hypothetical protein
VQQQAHRLELQAGLAPYALQDARGDLAPEAVQLREFLCFLADVAQPACVCRKQAAATDRSQGRKPG